MISGITMEWVLAGFILLLGILLGLCAGVVIGFSFASGFTVGSDWQKENNQKIEKETQNRLLQKHLEFMNVYEMGDDDQTA